MRAFGVLINQCPSRARMYNIAPRADARFRTAVGVSVYMHTLSFEGHVHRRGAHSIPRDANVVDSVVARGPGREGRETRLERERGERQEK